MIDTSWPVCMAICGLLLGVIAVGLWIDWKLNWRKGKDAQSGGSRGFEVIASGPAGSPPKRRPESDADQRDTAE